MGALMPCFPRGMTASKPVTQAVQIDAVVTRVETPADQVLFRFNQYLVCRDNANLFHVTRLNTVTQDQQAAEFFPFVGGAAVR